MSNKPKIKGSKKTRNPNIIKKLQTPVKIRIFHHIGDLAGCGNIRIIIPSLILNSYHSRDYYFEAMFNNRYIPHGSVYQDCSFVTFQRSATQQQYDMIRHFKTVNPTKKIVYEVDDDLFNIPEWNFAHGFYAHNRFHIEKIMSVCDGMIVSTEELKKLYSPYNSNIRVSPNHLPKFIWGEVKEKEPEEKIPCIMYAGSYNHFDHNSDKGDFGSVLIDFIKKTVNRYQWVFVGGIPTSLRNIDGIIHHEWKSVYEYPSFIKSLNPDIFLAPLDNIQFNRGKSNIKALEATSLGIPLIGSSITPYNNLPYMSDSEEEMISHIEFLAEDHDARISAWKLQYEILKDQLFWEDNNHSNMFHYINQHLRLMGKEL